ncbi:MAG TPA: tRNA dihydrouridine synthase DusB [Oscillospiraceae bacterium]|nr:tRNA dihydrouridine synthase DusB [Oscillospiraceae bacterium]HRW57366.1 tRNA dihydrouridine synthase DusB [Oscillospiraceae bacterium]
MKLGSLDLPKTAALAPMAGVADRAMRELCREMGACWEVCEMTSSKGLTCGSRKTAELLEITEKERPAAVQIFGSDPAVMAEAAQMAMEFHPDAIDINFGCPAPKIAGNGGGSALMKDPELAGKIVRAVADAVPVPVTVKFRAGWDEEHKNAVEFAKICEANGAAALTVHGRTRMQMYAPPVDMEIIRQVVEAVSVPVVGNGDVDSPEAAKRMYEETGCALVMVGRGALGNPWIFRRIEAYLRDGTLLPEPTPEERMDMLLRHSRLLCTYKGEHIGMRETRKHAAWYIKGMAGAASFRRECGELSAPEDLERLAERVLSGSR